MAVYDRNVIVLRGKKLTQIAHYEESWVLLSKTTTATTYNLSGKGIHDVKNVLLVNVNEKMKEMPY